MSVILINVFEVPAGSEEDFEAVWRETSDYLAVQPGYVSARLHRALASGARFSLINVAEWASPQDFQAAISREGFRRRAAPMARYPSTPGLYSIAYEHHV